MHSVLKKTLIGVAVFVLVTAILVVLLARKDRPERITYGISFNTPYVLELGLDPRETFLALLDDLEVRHFRLAAHWSMVEPQNGAYDFREIDFQLREAEKRDAKVIFGIGRRLPRWPECHVPPWAEELSWEKQKEEIRQYIEVVVRRYKDNPVITQWQVENEPFLTVFAYDHCGELDVGFLDEEIELVRSLDDSRPILVTDSGNLGTWNGAYKRGDVFGTSVYVYFWNPELGQFRTILPPQFYRIKENIMRLIYGWKPTYLIELSAEPWLLEPVNDVPLEVQYERMDVEKFDEILRYAQETRFERQYLWGGEWWYWLKENGHPEIWEKAKELYAKGVE